MTRHSKRRLAAFAAILLALLLGVLSHRWRAEEPAEPGEPRPAEARQADTRSAAPERPAREVAVEKPEKVAPKEPRGRRISGRVVRQDGSPARAWPVLLKNPGDRGRMGAIEIASTGKDGSFAFEGLAPRTYLVEAATSDWDRDYPGREVDLEPDADVEDVLLTLPQLFSLEIAVVDVRGAAVDGAWVDVAFANDLPSVETGSDGLARFELIDLNSVFVGVTPRGDGPRLYLPRYAIDVPRGQGSFRVVLEDAGVASGVVLSPNGDPVPDLELICSDEAGFVSRTTSDAEGRFRCAVRLDTPASLRVVADRFKEPVVAMPNGAERRVRGQLEGVRAGDHGLQLLLEWIEEGRTLTVEVQSPDGEPVAGAEVEVWEREPLEKQTATSDARGRVEFRELTGGPHGVRILPPPGGTARGWMRTKSVGIVPSGNTVELKFRKGIRVSGKILRPDGSPAGDAHLSGTNVFEEWLEPPDYFVDVDAEGRFSFLLDPAWGRPLRLKAWATIEGRPMTATKTLEPGETGESFLMELAPEE